MTRDECQELKNIKYKTMLLNGNTKNITSIIQDISNLDILLDEEANNYKQDSWNRLDKSVKMQKITKYINKIAPNYNLTNDEITTVRDYLSSNLDKKNLQRNKDVAYIKDTGTLENIPGLHFNNHTRKFTLRKQSQSSASKNLGPTRKKRSKTSPRSGENTHR